MTSSSPPFHISLDLALSGAGACPRDAFDAALKEGESALAWLRQHAEAFETAADSEAVRAVAAGLTKDTSQVAVLGTGRSSLVGKALLQLRGEGAKPPVSFHDNPDPRIWARALANLDLRTARFLVISRSGDTAATLAQATAAADAIEKAGGGKYLKYHFAIVTGAGPSPLRTFAERIGAPILEHAPGIAGRYAPLGVAGLLPALIMGLDVDAFTAGVDATLAAMLASDGAANAALCGAALHRALAGADHLDETVLWSDKEELAPLGAWWRELWAESNGNDAPVAMTAPLDSRSQYLRTGTDASLYTLLSTGTVDDAAEALNRAGSPVRTIHAARFDETTAGALMTFFLLEALVTARM
jgi:glucose-6-phosphate isomerase